MNNILTFCTRAENINFYPFREFTDYSELQYLILLSSSYISRDPNEIGILSKWDFSPDGRTFYAVVNPDARWQDGIPITALEAAIGIAKGITYREIGKRIKVAGIEEINSEGWENRSYSGIKIINDNEFQLTFESDISSLSGTLRDALSTGTRHNRIWPARLSKIKNNTYQNDFDLISKFPLSFEGGLYFINLGEKKIKILGRSASEECRSPDFSIHLIKESEKNNYYRTIPSSSQAAYLVINSKIEEIEKRSFIANMFRYAAKRTEDDGISEVLPSHFKAGEMGWDGSVSWSNSLPSMNPGLKKIAVATSIPVREDNRIRRAINELSVAFNIKVEWETINFREPPVEIDKYDIFWAGGRVSQGRQIWIQDISSNPLYQKVFQKYRQRKGFQKTAAILDLIAKKSSSTIPVNHVDLKKFDEIVREEISIIPLERFYHNYFSKTGSGLVLIPTENDELTFIGENVWKSKQ